MRSGIMSQAGGGGQRRHQRTASPKPTPSALSPLCSFLDPESSTSSGRCVSEGITAPGPATLTDSPGTPGCAHLHLGFSCLHTLCHLRPAPALAWLGSEPHAGLFCSIPMRSPRMHFPTAPLLPILRASTAPDTPQTLCKRVCQARAPTGIPGQPDPMSKLFQGKLHPNC